MSFEEIELLLLRSWPQQRFKISVIVYPAVFETAKHFVTKLGVVMHHNQPECQLSCKKIGLLFARSRSQQGLIGSNYDSFYYIFWTADPFATIVPTWFDGTWSWARVPNEEIGLLCSSSSSQQNFKVLMNVCPDGIFWTAVHYQTCIVVNHCNPECFKNITLLSSRSKSQWKIT